MATNILYLREFNKILVKYGCYNILENFYAEGIVDKSDVISLYQDENADEQKKWTDGYCLVDLAENLNRIKKDHSYIDNSTMQRLAKCNYAIKKSNEQTGEANWIYLVNDDALAEQLINFAKEKKSNIDYIEHDKQVVNLAGFATYLNRKWIDGIEIYDLLGSGILSASELVELFEMLDASIQEEWTGVYYLLSNKKDEVKANIRNKIPFDYPPYVLKKSADDTLKQGKYFLKAYNNNALLVFFDDKEFQMFLWDRLLACSLKW